MTLKYFFNARLSKMFKLFILISAFHHQGCGGTLNGTIPSLGNLQWSISGGESMGIYINFTDWKVHYLVNI